MKKTGRAELLLLVVLTIIVGVSLAFTQNSAKKFPVVRGPVQRINPHFSTQAIAYSDGVILQRNGINGPRVPPAGYERERASVSKPELNATTAVNLPEDVPAYRWVFGCSAVSGAMIAGYYDRMGFYKIYEGPTNGGVIPLTEYTGWGDWFDISGDHYPNNPLIASHYGLDGRTSDGSIDDYWVSYSSSEADPYIGGEEHGWGDAIGDYMKTSQSEYGNKDGWTMFYWNTSGYPLTCDAMETYETGDGFYISDIDGTYGMKQFYKARGYEVTDCYSQLTDNVSRRGFTFEQFMAEIDAGRPVFINLVGHSIVGVGYDASTGNIYIHDTWDNSTHTMRWGGSYSGMKLRSVSIVNIQQAAGPNISVSPASLDFGSIALGAESSEAVTISNTGSADLTIYGIEFSEATDDFSVYVDNCSGKLLEPSSSCTVEVIFAPVSDGPKSADLMIPSEDPDEPDVHIALTGSGLSSGDELDLSGSWGGVTYERKGKGTYKVYGTLTIENNGGTDLSSVEVQYYFSRDPESVPDQPFLTEYWSIPAGRSIESAIVYNAGKTSPEGGSLIAHIDPSDQIVEAEVP